MKKIVWAAFVWVVSMVGAPVAEACTSAVVSGKATKDGRPLLWKHRDTGFLENHVEFVKGEKYDFMAVVNSADFAQKHEAWIGTNSAGFALMNTQSYNLVKITGDEERGEANGRVIYRALEVCATVEDFCHFLDTLAKPSGIEANFGVIDAQGGAAMFEVDYYQYKMYDANRAPQGYIVRTNFSESGQHGVGAGRIRFMEADSLMREVAGRREVTPPFIFNRLSRSFHNPVLDIDLYRDADYQGLKPRQWFIDQDFIPRSSTSCSVVVQGVRPQEDASLTTMWTLLGYPPTGVFIPLWLQAGREAAPSICLWDDELKTSPLSFYSLQLKDRVFGLDMGMGSDRYLHWSLLYRAGGKGYMQQLRPLEDEVYRRTIPVLESCRGKGRLDVEEVKTLYRKLEKLDIVGAMRRLLQQE